MPTLQRILSFSEDELKNEEKKVISSISKSMESLAFHVLPNSAESIEKFNLEIAKRFLHLPVLQKRLAGLNDIKEAILKVTEKSYHWVTTQ
jgi:hypothetical protein